MNDKPLRIAMITPFFSPNIGGVETHLDDLCEYFVRRGHHVSVITYQPLASKRKASSLEANEKLTIMRINWLGNGLFNKLEPFPLFEIIYLFPALFLRTLFFALSNRKRIDIIVAHGLVAALVVKFVGLFLRKPTLATIHTIYNLDTKPLVGKIFAWTLHSFDKILFVSCRIRDEFVNLGIASKKTEVFTYWADNLRFAKLDNNQAKTKIGWDGKFVVLFVGRLIKEKGVDVLVKAAQMTNKNISFAFVTSGSYEEFKKVVGGTIPSNVIYVGPVDYSLLHLYYNAADLFVLPSPNREGFSRAVLESILCGTPVIASNVGCLPEVVNSSVGRLVDPPTSKNFSKIIEYYYVNKKELDELSRACVIYAQKKFSENVNSGIVEKCYRDLTVI